MMHDNHDLQLNLDQGVLEPVIYLPSPHQDDRPKNTVIDLIVVHCISLPKGVFGTNAVAAFFCGTLDCNLHPSFAHIKSVRVSPHLFIRRDGELIQFVPFTKRAWHAGQSRFNGRSTCNDFSIGIELEGTDDSPFEIAQYNKLATVIHLLMQCYPDIKHDHIVGHADISPGRKQDPGRFFDWRYLKGMLS